jgi:hypothetical protein
MPNRPDAKTVIDACYAALAELGIQKKYLGGILPLNADFLGTIGLASGVHADVIRVHPSIGIHCIPLMKLVDAAVGEKYQKGRFPTISFPLGVTCPDIAQFHFKHDADILPESARLAATIKQYGIPYIHNLASYSELIPHLRQRVESLGGNPERYAVALYLSGDRDSAFSFLDEFIIKFLAENDLDFAARYKKFKAYLAAL